jgi:hypothetical protein
MGAESVVGGAGGWPPDRLLLLVGLSAVVTHERSLVYLVLALACGVVSPALRMSGFCIQLA